jgi:beta-galactosidase
MPANGLGASLAFRAGVTVLMGLALVVLASAQPYTPPPDPRQVVSLDNGWRFNLGDVAGAEEVGFPDSGWPQVNLPHTWNNLDGQDGGNNYQRTISWYRLHFTPPGSLAGKRLFLKFHGASLVTTVFVNGEEIGSHRGGFSAFTFDVTDHVTPGVANLLAVKVDNRLNSDVMPITGDLNVYGGIYRSVQLIGTDPIHVDPTDFGSSGVYLRQSNVSAAAADLEVTVKLRNDGAASATVNVIMDVVDADDELAESFSTTRVVPAGGSLDVVEAETISSPRLWQGRPDPHLYRVFVRIEQGGTLRDLIQERLGFRTFQVSPSQGFSLNGQPYELRGVNFHQDRLNKGWATSVADQTQDVALIAEVGATVVRMSHYQHHPKTYDLLDEQGIIVWSEIPNLDLVTNSTPFFDNAKQQLREMIRQNFNRPSVLFWGLGNSLSDNSVANSLVSQLHTLATQEDPDRLTTLATVQSVAQTAPLNQITDVVAVNDYWGWYRGVDADFAVWVDGFHQQLPQRPLGVSEFGAGSSIVQHQEKAEGVRDDFGPFHPEEFQAQFYEAHIAQMTPRDFLWAKIAWQMFDHASDWRNEGDTPGRNDKGLVTYNRQTRKDAFFFLKAHWSSDPVLYIASRRFTTRPDNRVEVKVYSNLSQVELRVNGASLGTRTGTNRVFTWTDVALAAGANSIQALESGGTLTDTVNWTAPASGSTVNGVTATYFDNSDFTGVSLTKHEFWINFNWRTGNPAPDALLGNNSWSARWTGRVRPQFSETYTFFTRTNDGVRLWVNGQLLINAFVTQSGTVERSGTIALVANQDYDLVMEHFDNTGDAVAELLWQSPSRSKQTIPNSRLRTTVGPGGPPPPGDGLVGVDINTGVAGSTTEVTPDVDYDVVAEGVDIWGTADSFHFSQKEMTGDFDQVVQIESFTGPDVGGKAGLMVRESLSANSRNVFVGATIADQGFRFSRRSSTGGTTQNLFKGGTVTFPNVWVRLTRQGNVFTGYSSTDGVNWTQLGQTTLSLPATLFFGLASNSRSAGNTANVDYRSLGEPGAPPPPPGGLDGLDINTGVAGSTTEVTPDVDYDVEAEGVDIWGTADSFHFSHTQVTGDFDQVVQIESFTGPDVGGKAGLMVRESLSANSRNVFVGATIADQGFRFSRRSSTGGTTQNLFKGGTVTFPNVWVRLTRQGNVFTGFTSSNGTTWAQRGQVTLSLPATLFFGLATNSRSAGNTADAEYRSLGPP